MDEVQGASFSMSALRVEMTVPVFLVETERILTGCLVGSLLPFTGAG